MPRSGLERAEAPGGAPWHPESVVPRRRFSPAGVVLCGLEVGDQAEGATRVDQQRVHGGVASVVAYRVGPLDVGVLQCREGNNEL